MYNVHVCIHIYAIWSIKHFSFSSMVCVQFLPHDAFSAHHRATMQMMHVLLSVILPVWYQLWPHKFTFF